MTSAYTTNFVLEKPTFDTSTWHDAVNNNMDILDAVLAASGVAAVTGSWAVSTSYAVSNRVVDNVDGTLWQCLVAHTSASSGVFSADRATNPTYWSIIDTTLVYRGAWVAATAYVAGDFVYDIGENLVAYCIAPHTSNASIRTDAVYWVFIVDLQTVTNYLGTTDRLRNLVTNPCMQSSQENDNTLGTTSSYYMADENLLVFSTSGAVSGQRIQSRTLSGALDRLRISVTTADTSLSAGEYLVFLARIEGSKFAEAEFGTLNAKDLVFRFMGNFPAGTYAVSLRNRASTRSFVREITAVAGVDTVYEVTFPGETTGVWDTGDQKSARLAITLATGATFQTTKDAWQTGNYFGTSSVSNGLGAVQSFDIGDVGLRIDSDSTGVYGDFEVPDIAENLVACQRYFIRLPKSASSRVFSGYATSSTKLRVLIPLPVTLRTLPTIGIIIANTRIQSNGFLTAPTAISVVGFSHQGVVVDFTTTGLTTYQTGAVNVLNTTDIDFDSRM